MTELINNGIAPLDGICSSDTIVINAKEEQYKALVLACVSSEHFVAFASRTSQGTHMPRANWSVLTTYPMVIHLVHVLSLFNDFVRSAVDSLSNLIFRNRNLRRTRDLLLPKLISGEIDVSSWSDEAVEAEETVTAQGRGEVSERMPASTTPIDVSSLEQRSPWR
jgi:type I restriction enzyme S subunit